MSTPTVQSVKITDFLFGSMFFSGTRLDTLRFSVMQRAINRWYMPLVRAGHALPFAFILDVGALLIRGRMAFRDRWKDAAVPEAARVRSREYFQYLQTLRRDPVFQRVHECVRELGDVDRQDGAIAIFFRYWLQDFHSPRLPQIRFDSHDLRVDGLKLRANQVRDLDFRVGGKQRKVSAFSLSNPAAAFGAPIVGLLASGIEASDIVAGVQRAIAARVAAMAGREVAEPIVFAGGVALVPGMERAMAAVLKRPVSVAPSVPLVQA